MAIPAEQILGITAGVITSVSSLPQLVKIVKEKEAKDISLKMLLILVGGVILWIIYGILKKDVPIILTNCLSLLINTVLVFLRLKYGHK
jgi:MtN3 and saliva related transmembrane protein